MKRTFSSYIVDFIVLEPALALLAASAIVMAPKGTFASPGFSVDVAVGLIFGGATTLIFVLGLLTFVFMRLPSLVMHRTAKLAWAIALLLAAPVALPVIYWQHLRHEFLPDSLPSSLSRS